MSAPALAATLGLGAIRSVVAPDAIDNRAAIERFGANPKKIGMETLARLRPGSDTSDLAIAATRRLFEDGLAAPEEIECLVLVTQNPDGHGIPHSSARLQAELELPEACACFDVGLGCSGFVYGLSIVQGFLERAGMRRGLLVTADPYSKIIDPEDRDTALLFGDAAAAALITDQPEFRIVASDFGTRGASGDALRVQANGRLTMNGRAVFEFSATEVPRSIDRVLARAGWGRDAVDRFLVHQGSRYIVERIARALDAPERTPFAAADTGNAVSSSVPLLLERCVQPTDQRLVVSGFGVGLSWASAALERTGPKE